MLSNLFKSRISLLNAFKDDKEKIDRRRETIISALLDTLRELRKSDFKNLKINIANNAEEPVWIHVLKDKNIFRFRTIDKSVYPPLIQDNAIEPHGLRPYLREMEIEKLNQIYTSIEEAKSETIEFY